MQINSQDSIQDILERNLNKTVKLYLLSGESLEGRVSAVGETLTHLSEITGREFYDAVVRTDQIGGLMLRTR